VNRPGAALIIALLMAASASAQSRDQLESWIQKLASLRQRECAGEDKKKVIVRIEYAATLIAHGEVEEAETALAQAGKSATTTVCKQALERLGKLSATQ